ncbi:MAG: AbrB/MazE/SpoVT family DNA-binding domain-containing protein [candidate division KSB1 bacterium]|nr:AbrB/MazE/SpoVT family DNA-binding domain-containing protein [candidate division KSB1 bacterium]MDQ7065374.1 AbrB/MazE/SpoVT family DNA-binding domain-containing protein [candidate division KSB1 bacterium]
MYKLSKVSQKGGIIIPKEIREKIGLEPGMLVAFIEDNGGFRVVPVPKNPIKYARGMLKKYGKESLTKILLEERRKDNEREEAEIARWMK